LRSISTDFRSVFLASRRSFWCVCWPSLRGTDPFFFPIGLFCGVGVVVRDDVIIPFACRVDTPRSPTPFLGLGSIYCFFSGPPPKRSPIGRCLFHRQFFSPLMNRFPPFSHGTSAFHLSFSFPALPMSCCVLFSKDSAAGGQCRWPFKPVFFFFWPSPSVNSLSGAPPRNVSLTLVNTDRFVCLGQ